MAAKNETKDWLSTWLKTHKTVENEWNGNKSWRWMDGEETCQIIKLVGGKITYYRHEAQTAVEITDASQLPN